MERVAEPNVGGASRTALGAAGAIRTQLCERHLAAPENGVRWVVATGCVGSCCALTQQVVRGPKLPRPLE
jgi:hypothetical protein